MRITQQMLDRNLLQTMGRNFKRYQELVEQLSTGRRVNKFSDDPVAARQILRLQRENGRLESYLGNIREVNTMLSGATSTVQNISDSLARAREYGLQAASETYSDADRQAIAAGLDGILGHLVALANTRLRGQCIFGGASDESSAYVTSTDSEGRIQDVSYRGSATTTQVPVGPSATSEANLKGPRVLERGGALFDTFIRLRDAVSAGGTPQTAALLDELESVHQGIVTSLGELGEKSSQLQGFGGTLENYVNMNTQVLSEQQDADVGELSVEYNRILALLQTAMKVNAQAIQPSMVEFL